eukprot:5009099-Prymnesium_polylepis.1
MEKPSERGDRRPSLNSELRRTGSGWRRFLGFSLRTCADSARRAMYDAADSSFRTELPTSAHLSGATLEARVLLPPASASPLDARFSAPLSGLSLRTSAISRYLSWIDGLETSKRLSKWTWRASAL